MLIAHPVAGKAKSRMLCEAFIAGAPKSATGHVFWGVNESNVAAWAKVKLRGENWWFGDNSYFDCVRGEQFRWTKNRVQVDPTQRTSTGERFAALGLELKPMRRVEHGVTLFVDQSPSYMATVAGGTGWWSKVAAAHAFGPVRFRAWNRNKAEAGSTLQQDLAHTNLLVTYSSAAAVEALVAGVEILVSEMSAVHSLSMIPEIWTPGARLRTLQVLADGQFTIEQMRNGEAWEWSK